jgi:pyruvate formate lyase activating enzyme
MKICGFQKTTLLDYPGITACSVFTGGCNLRCPYCHNPSLVIGSCFEEIISETDFFAFLKKRRGVLDGVCITGGEPLIHSDIKDFIVKIKKEGYLVKLDTNGSQPNRLKELVLNGLVNYVAMDIKSSPVNYARAVGLPDIDLSKIQESINFLMENHTDYEFRTTAVKGIHTVDDFLEIGKWIAGAEKFFIQNYIDSGDTLSSKCGFDEILTGFSQTELNLFLALCRKNLYNTALRGV